MRRSAILKAAIKERQAGKPAEEVYKTYQGQVRPNNALAMAIASVADPERKRRYAVLNYILVALLILVAVLKTLSLVMFSNLSPGLMVGAVVLGLIAPLGFAYVIARFDGRVYSLLISLAFLSALKILFEEGNSVGKLADLVLPAAIIALAFVAQRKIFPNMRLFRVKKSADGSYVWARRLAEATAASSSLPPATPPSPAPPAATPPHRRNWWSRNWVWFVPAGCLTILVCLALVVCAFVLLVVSAVKSSDFYRMGVARAKSDARVQAALGANLHDGMFLPGDTRMNGSLREYEFRISISGSKGKGTIYLVVAKSAGQYQIDNLSVKTNDGEIIDLNETNPSSVSNAARDQSNRATASQVKAVDYLEPANTQKLLVDIQEDFGQGAQFKEISIDHNGATVKAAAPGKRDEIQQYTYDARERAKPESSNFPKSPFDSFEEKDLFGIAELQSFEARIPELEKKTIERLRIPDGRIKHLTFYRRSPFYPGNKKLLLQIYCEGKGDGRVVYDPSGSEYDIVGGHPLGPVQTTAPQMKTGIFVGKDARFTGPDSSKTSDQEVEALLKQWNAVMDADAAAEEKCNATRWGQLAEKGPVTPADISREDSREYRLAERGRIETAKKCLAFLERPKTKALMPQLMTKTERQGLDHRKFFDLDFWRATIRRMTASNELKKLTEEHWEEFRHGGYPTEGPNLKPWQRKYLGLEAEEKAAREERHRIIEKYRGGGSN